jgi:hypothetical protein
MKHVKMIFSYVTPLSFQIETDVSDELAPFISRIPVAGHSPENHNLNINLFGNLRYKL